jgi:3-hydroxyacyl-[acyl-carrier-protein] dehydratase
MSAASPELLDRLPHRHPIALVDRVLDLEPGVSITTVKAVSANEPCFQHLGPLSAIHQSTLPQILLLESLAQSGALLWFGSGHAAEPGATLVFGGLRDCRFHRSVPPGTLVTHHVRLDAAAGSAAFFSGESYADGRLLLTVASIAVATHQYRPSTRQGTTR